MVAQEYKGFGFGPLLVGLERKLTPFKPCGGFTPDGIKNLRKVYLSFVSDALKSGRYTALVKSKKMTVARVKEIVESSMKYKSEPKPEMDYSTSNKNDWLVYVGEYGDFVLYDKKVRTLIEDGWDKNDRWIRKMILGSVYVNGKNFFLQYFGGHTTEIKRIMMALALEYCRRHNQVLWVENDEKSFVNSQYGTVGEETNVIGFKSSPVTPTGKEFNYDPLAIAERRFRKSFDQYGEFGIHIQELGASEFR